MHHAGKVRIFLAAILVTCRELGIYLKNWEEILQPSDGCAFFFCIFLFFALISFIASLTASKLGNEYYAGWFLFFAQASLVVACLALLIKFIGVLDDLLY